ncbi:putative exonuclease [Rostrohypoxylon terebratum]|nr:putative exonuclease [Rostrohypoxylon terebratum]
MGIQGLLPLLKSIQKPTELKKYRGETFGVDAYGWLHRGTVSCATELAQCKPTRKYVDFAMNRVKMLQHFGITPYLVFDGGYLPSKAGTEASREKRREESKKTGLELLKAGKPAQAHPHLQKAVDVTPEMARHLIEELKKVGVPYVVAPYEADPQLVYLEKQGHISGILSEDSDLLVFGAKRLLTKLDQYGQCIEINRRDFCLCREVSLTGWTDSQFRHMAILSGCDYLASINNLGLKTAHRMMRKHKTPERVVRMLEFDGKYRVPAGYLDMFRQAEQTFLYQWVFCPKANELVHFSDPGPGIKADELPFIGSFIAPEVARGIAAGDVNPITKQPIVLMPRPSPRKRTASGSTPAVSHRMRVPSGKPTDPNPKGHRRIPLGSMDPNCFTVDPARVSALTDNGNQSIVYPLPRPYIPEDRRASTTNIRNYLLQPESTTRTLRRRTEPVSNLISNDGSLAPRAPQRHPSSSGNNATINLQGTNTNPARPSKKARLCDDDNSAPSPSNKSKFFSVRSTSNTTSKKGMGYLMSDDSIEGALMDLPDLSGWGKLDKGQKEVAVYEEVQSANDEIPKDDDEEKLALTTPSKSDTAQGYQYPHAAAISLDLLKKVNVPPRRRSGLTSHRSSLLDLTPASSTAMSTPLSSFSYTSTASTVKTTPGSTRLTPLERLGAQALSRHKQPLTPTYVAPQPVKRSGLGRPSLDSLPINPAFVPLPPVDLEEVEALHRPLGSEDLMVSGDDDEEEQDFEVEDGQENVGERKKRGTQKMDLSRFRFA